VAVVTDAPVGTIALLFTDIEGSTRLVRELGGSWPGVLAEHHAIVGGAIAREGGFVDRAEGDAFVVTFVDARAAARAAVAALRGLRSQSWPSAVGELRVRMGLHVGYVERWDTGYVGLEVHRAARVAAAAWGGQLLMTSAARALVGDLVETEPLGAHRLKDFPSPELLFCAVVDGRGAAFFPPPRTQQIRATNLPAGLRPLVGRESELERVRDAFLIDHERLVTLTGRGGVGKTSLAMTAAADLLDEHPGGVWLIRLATVTSPEEVLPMVAGVVGVDASADESPLVAITDRLSGRGPTLLVLDNLEHLLAAARSVAALLELAPDVRVLVTSQAPLRLTNERCLRVDSLDEASALVLIERVARRRDASFTVGDYDRAVLAEIVSMLEGLPLALELAAARLGLLTVVQLLARLRASTDVLRDDVRDRSDRHRSLRATVEWTLGSVDPPARELFVRMGAFAGPVELTELEAVAGTDALDVLDALSGLLDVALARRVEPGDGRITFGFPEAVRQIAAGMLDNAHEGDRWRRAHAQRQLDLQWAARSYSTSLSVWEAAIAADAEAALALEWAQAIDEPVAGPLAAAYATVLVLSSRPLEALAILEGLLGSPPADPEVHTQAQIAKASAVGRLGRHADRLAAANAAVALATEDRTRAQALLARAFAYLVSGDVDAAIADNEQATALSRGLNREELSYALMMEGQSRLEAGQVDLAAELVDEAEQLSTGPLAHYAPHSFDGDLAIAREQPQEAARHYAASLEWSQQRNDHEQIWLDLNSLAEALALNHDDVQALEIAGIAAAQTRDLGAPGRPVWHVQGRDPLPEAEKRLGPEAAAQARQHGLDVDPGYRVTHACQLARSRQPATR
jgi:predicted ATPase/class 3 adenylate cyclase